MFAAFQGQDCLWLENTLKDKRFKMYLHSDLKERKKLYLVNNNYCVMNTKSVNIEVITIDESAINKHKNYIKIRNMSNVNDKTIVTIDYPIEGAVFSIYLNSKHEIIDIDVIEK